MKTVKCVVPISGGKDSQACLQLAVAHFGKEYVIGLFCDTQFEHPLTYEHVERMGEMYGVEIITRCGGSVIDQIEKRGRFPSFGARFCTNYLKTDVSKKFYEELADYQRSFKGHCWEYTVVKRQSVMIEKSLISLKEWVNSQGFSVWYGMRTGESNGRAKRYADIDPFEYYAPHQVLDAYPQKLGKKGVTFRLPIVDWKDREVFEFLGGDLNPLYKLGFERVGCFPCLAGGDLWKEKAFTFDDFGHSQHEKIKVLEQKLGKSVFTSKGGWQRNNPDQASLDFACICEI